MAEDRKESLLAFAMPMHFAMLDVDHTNDTIRRRNDRNRQECFVFVFWKRVKNFRPAVFVRVTRDSYGLDFLGHPARNSLSHFQSNLADQSRMWIF
jgi:hypothetical protein